jgi:hypothetical protein
VIATIAAAILFALAADAVLSWCDRTGWVGTIRERRAGLSAVRAKTAQRDAAAFRLACLVTGEMADGYDVEEARGRVYRRHPDLVRRSFGVAAREASDALREFGSGSDIRRKGGQK